MAFDPDAPHRLSPRVGLRPEPFGALAYHYGNRRLTFHMSEARSIGAILSFNVSGKVWKSSDLIELCFESQMSYASSNFASALRSNRRVSRRLLPSSFRSSV